MDKEENKEESKEEIEEAFSYIVPEDKGIDNMVNYIRMKIEKCILKIQSILHKKA